MHHFGKLLYVLGGTLLLAACAPERPVAANIDGNGGGSGAPRMSITSDDGYYTLTELPESQQDWVHAGDLGSPPVGYTASKYCPATYPEAGYTAPPLWIYYTVSHLNGFPVQRKFYFPTPYSLNSQGTVGVDLHCSYNNQGGSSQDGDWQLSNGKLLTISNSFRVPAIGFRNVSLKAYRYEGGSARRVACGGQLIFDPSQPCDTPGGPSSGGGGGTSCEEVWMIVEINYNDGTGWHELWGGYVQVCN